MEVETSVDPRVGFADATHQLTATCCTHPTSSDEPSTAEQHEAEAIEPLLTPRACIGQTSVGPTRTMIQNLHHNAQRLIQSLPVIYSRQTVGSYPNH